MKSRRTTRIVLLSFLAMILPQHQDTLIAQERHLVWSDEFSGSSIDRSQWQFGKGTTNDNIQFYTDRIENAQINGGVLQIITKKESYSGFGYTSALLETRDAVCWRYGRVEARIRVPGTAGLVPAFWMRPADAMYGWWPNSGEIDIMEYPTTQGGTIYGTLHAQSYSYFTGTTPLGGMVQVPDAATTFHTYAIEWSPEQIDFFVDQNKYFTVMNDHSGYQKWPFDQPFYVILNVAVGGGWVGAPPLNSVFPAMMEIDFIRVYQTLSDIRISGDDYVAVSAQNVTYAVPQIAGATYVWTVPSTAQIVAGQNTSTITVNWGNAGGDVSARTTASSGSATSHYLVEVSNNLLRNPGFEKGVKYWNGIMSPLAQGSFGLDTSTVTYAGHSIRASMSATPTNPWDVQISQQGFRLEAGKQYEAKLWAKCAVAGAKITAAVINAESYALYGWTTFTLTDIWKEYSFRFTAPLIAVGSFNLDLGLQPATYYCDDIALRKLDDQTGNQAEDDFTIPRQNSLGQNYPNPFNPETVVRYQVSVFSKVDLRVYDFLGRNVAVLVNGEKMPGTYTVTWDAKGMASGIFFYQLSAGGQVFTRKMILLR
jgi:beta-glucanase (GH16 family)